MKTLSNPATMLTSKHPFLVDMDRRHLDILLHDAQEQHFEPDEIIFREGEPANRFYLIVWGEVALESKCPGKEMVHIQTLHDGDVFGWSWLFPPFAWNFQARALKGTRVLACDGAHLLVISEENDEFGHALMKRVAHVAIQRLQGVRRQLIQVQSILAGRPATAG